jgi:hypothetical protein
MNKLLKTAATAASVLSIAGGGLAGVAGASSASTQGPDSPIRIHARNHQTWTNNNNVGVSNSTTQRAHTGEAEVNHNTTGGSATSGMASNDNSFSADLSVTNGSGGGGGAASSMGGADLSTAGPNSPISVHASNNTTVTNNNNLSVSNTTTQSAHSGEASVEHNTTGGDATSGDASNTNSSSVTITVSN